MKYTLYVIIIALFASIFFVFQKQSQYTGKKAEVRNISQPYVSADFGGKFNMLDHNGDPITDENFEGSYKLIYFGFTFCPSICPTELQKMIGAYDALPDDKKEKIKPIFITLDPERDTPDVMREYVALFHDDLIGMTGSLQQVSDMADSYKVYAAKNWEDGASDYTIDHSSYMYLMSPDEKLLDVFKISTPEETVTANLMDRVS